MDKVTSGYKILYPNLCESNGYRFHLNKWKKCPEGADIYRDGFYFCTQAPFCMLLVNDTDKPVYTRVECRGQIRNQESGFPVCSEMRIVDILSRKEWERICTGKFFNPKYGLRYFKNGLLHRCDGPAVIKPDGTMLWYQNGIKNHETGSVIVHRDEDGEWH